MAQISSHPYDAVVQDQDAWIGTDAMTRQTKQYTASAVATYLNVKGKVSIGAQLPYKFIVTPNSSGGTFALPSGGNAIPFSDITSIKISASDLSAASTVEFLQYMVSSDIMIGQMNAPSIFGHFKVSTYTVDPNDANFYTLVLNHIGSNGSLVNDYYYDIFNFTLASASDKTYVHDQAIPSETWTITHNLGKFPSVSVVDTQKTVYWGNVEYINSNQLKVTFSAGFAGQAFLN